MERDAVVWLVDGERTRSDAAGPGRGDDALSDDERARAARMRDPRERRWFVAVHLALREVIAEATGLPAGGVEFLRAPCTACGGPHGKPYAREAPEFSLSRSGRWGLIALADRPVGVDLEVRRVLERPLPDLLAPGETSGDELRTWVRKEALLKATGTGLTAPLSSIRADDPRVIDLDLAGRAGDEFIAALAFTDATPRPTKVHAR